MKRTLTDDWFPGELPVGLKLGHRSYIVSSYVFLHSAPTANIWIGNDTGIYHGTFFEVGADARVQIGDFCTVVGAVLCIQSELRIGNHTLIAHDVVITDCETNEFAVCPSERSIIIGDDVWIGMRSIILAGVNVGYGAVVAAGAVVANNVPPLTIVAGNPARLVRKIDR